MFEKTTLDNGVRVLTERISSVRSISVGAWIGVGSRHEHRDEGGICHFIEHMVFKGTEHRRMHHIAQRMENVGGYLNAFTSKEYTCFYARALDEHLPRAIDTVCDLVLYPSLPEKEIEREKDVVIEEMRMYDDTPEDRIFDLVDTVVYPDHAMGQPVIGREETVRAMTRDSLSAFMERNFVPNRMVIAVAGNVDHARTVRLVEKVFRKSGRPPVQREIVPVPPSGPRKKLVDERPVQQAHLVLAARAYDVHNPRRGALSVLNTLLGGGMSSRLNQNIREKYGYCYNIYSYVNLHSDVGDFGVYMGTDAKHVDHAEKLIFREMDKLRQKPVSERMLERSKSQVKGGIMLGLESMGSRMMRIGRQELFYDAYFSLDEVLEMIDAVTVTDVQSVAEDLLGRDRFSTVRLIPQRS